MNSMAHTIIHLSGEATHSVYPFGDETLGEARIGSPSPVATILSTNPDHLLQLAEQLMDAAYAMDPALRPEVPA